MIGLVPILDFRGRLSAVGRQGKENRTPAYGAMQDPLFTEKGVTPDDHYEKARAWAVGNRTWHDQNHVGDSRIYLGIPPGLFPRNSCIILKKVPHYNGHRRNRLLRRILQGIPKDLQGAANRDIGMIPGMQAGQNQEIPSGQRTPLLAQIVRFTGYTPHTVSR